MHEVVAANGRVPEARDTALGHQQGGVGLGSRWDLQVHVPVHSEHLMEASAATSAASTIKPFLAPGDQTLLHDPKNKPYIHPTGFSRVQIQSSSGSELIRTCTVVPRMASMYDIVTSLWMLTPSRRSLGWSFTLMKT